MDEYVDMDGDDTSWDDYLLAAAEELSDDEDVRTGVYEAMRRAAITEMKGWGYDFAGDDEDSIEGLPGEMVVVVPQQRRPA